MPSESELIKKCQKGNTKAQESIYRKYASVLYGLCFRYTKNKMEADDVLQEAFIKIFSSIDQYKFKGSFEGWMKRITVTTAINIYRKNLNQRNEYDLEVADNYFEENDIIEKISADEIIELIQSLSDGYRMIFNMYVIEGYNHREIGELLGISENTSKSQLSRARKILQKKILKKTETTINTIYEQQQF